jgi:hypothetical protein
MYIWHLNPTIFTIFFLCTIPDCRYNDIQQQRLSVTSIITVTIFIYHFYLYTFDIQLRRHLPFSLLPLYVFSACSYQLRIPIRSTELRRTTFPHIHVLTKPFLFYTVLLYYHAWFRYPWDYISVFYSYNAFYRYTKDDLSSHSYLYHFHLHYP